MDHSGEKEFYTCLLYFFKRCAYLYLATFTTWRVDFILPCLFLLASVFFTPGVQLGAACGGVALGGVQDRLGQICVLEIFNPFTCLELCFIK